MCVQISIGGWPWVERGIEAIVSTASGCGTLVKDYGDLLRHDLHYAEKAARISALARDISEVISQIATANIVCYSFLQQEAHVPVKHWIELLDTSVT